MKTFKKILWGLLILVVLVIISGLIYVYHISHRALPDYNQNIELSGLTDKVTVHRDAHAVPHVYAKNEHDLYLTVGYLMAQDRLWQMDLLRRVTMGRLSEIFGDRMVDTDHLLRALRMTEKSKLVYSKSDQSIIDALDAFCKGVNQYIENNSGKLPPEFTILGYKPEPWEPYHSINLIGYMAWDLTGSWNTEVLVHKLRSTLDESKFLELVPDLDQHKTYVHPSSIDEAPASMFSMLNASGKLQEIGVEIFNGSNNWAVSAQKSESGHPLLSNDMHLGLNAPGIWYQMHHVVEGELNVTGVVLPGQPLVIVGHNERIAWGMTNVYVDDIDFFFEKINEEDPNQYLFNGKWKDIKVCNEKIAVKGGDTISKEIKFTHRGPIISGFKKVTDQAISMQWTGNLYSNELRTVYLLNRARDWNDFRNALTTMTSVSQNVIYADVDGNIGLQTAAGAPIRKDGNGIYIYPGETDQYDWQDLLPFDKLPSTYNPSQGHISSANNRTTGDDYPYYIGYWYTIPNRAERIIEMLNQKEKHGIDDFKDMLADFKSKHVERYLQGMVNVLSTVSSLSPTEKMALESLTSWNMVMTKESVAATVFEKFFLVFVKNIVQDELGDDLFTEFTGSGLNREIFDHIWLNQASQWIDNVNTPEKETFEDILLISFRESVKWLEDTYGNDTKDWKWGSIHKLSLNHPLGSVKILDRIFGLNRGPFSVGGSYHTVSPYSYSFRNPFNANHGSSQRHIYDLSDWDKSQVVIPTGTSGIPASSFYCDQTDMYINYEYKTDAFSLGEVKKNAKYTAIFSPRRQD